MFMVGIRVNNHTRELLSWAIVKVVEPGSFVLADYNLSRSFLERQTLVGKPFGVKWMHIRGSGLVVGLLQQGS